MLFRSLPLLPSSPPPEQEVADAEAREILASTSTESDSDESTQAIVEALVDATVPVQTQPDPVPALSEESRLAEELLGKMGEAVFVMDAPLPPLKGADRKQKAARKRK